MFKVIRILACISKNNGLGKENRLLYSIPEDMARFKALTTGHTIIMGRRTYESLPNGALPNRRNIVLSRTARDYAGCEVYNSLDEALKHCDGDVYIIGGASVYEEAMNRCDELLLTIVDDVYPDALCKASFHFIIFRKMGKQCSIFSGTMFSRLGRLPAFS